MSPTLLNQNRILLLSYLYRSDHVPPPSFCCATVLDSSQGSRVFKGRVGGRRRREEGEQRCALRVRYADQGEGRGVCVVCGGIGRSGRGALQRRGRSVGKHVGEKRNAEQAEPVRKGNHRSDEGDPKPPKRSAATKRQRRVRGQQKEGPRAPHHGKAEDKETRVELGTHTESIKKRSIQNTKITKMYASD
jgi:hypothetical protein